MHRYTRRLIYAKLIIVSWKYNIHANERLTKVKKKNDQLLSLMFLFFLSFFLSNVPDNKCQKHKWHVPFFTRMKLLESVLACARAMTRIKTGVTRKRKKEESDIVKLLKNCTKEKR